MNIIRQSVLWFAFAGLILPLGESLAQPIDIKVTRESKSKKRETESKPVAKPAPVTRFEVTGNFQSTREEAKASAYRKASEQIKEYLSTLTPPIHVEPAPDLLARMVLPDEQYKEESLTQESSGQKYTQLLATVTVELQADHIRELRGRERSTDVLSYLGVGALIFFALAAFFRVDVMTKGYLTTWLGLGAVFIAMMAIFWWGMAWNW